MPVGLDDVIQVQRSHGPRSLQELSRALFRNTTRTQGRKSITKGVEAASKYMVEQLAAAVPVGKPRRPKTRKYRRGVNPGRKPRRPGDLRKNVTFRIVRPKARTRLDPIGRGGFKGAGYVWNFLEGTEQRRTRSFWSKRDNRKYSYPEGKGPNRGRMHQRFDINYFVAKHTQRAEEIMYGVFVDLLNIRNPRRAPKSIPEVDERVR